VVETGQPYAYTGDNPVNATDPLGLLGCSSLGFLGLSGACHKAVKGVKEEVRAAKTVLHSQAAHAILNDVGKVSGAIAAVSSAIAVVTAGTPLGAAAEIVSLTAGGVAVSADLANCLGDHCDYTQLALDGTALIPGIAATRLGRVATDAADTAELASRAAHASPNSLMDAETVLSNVTSFQRSADTIGFGLSTAGWGVSVANSNL
jgi:hypothetical protein